MSRKARARPPLAAADNETEGGGESWRGEDWKGGEEMIE